MKKWLGLSLKIVAFTIACTLAAIVLAWLIGRVASDRWLWSQWLSWIPTPAPLLASVLGLLLAARPAKSARRRNRLAMRWAVVLVLITGYFGLIEHHMLRKAGTRTDGVKIVHWNMSQWKYQRVEQFAEALTSLEGDLIVVSGIDQVSGEPLVRQWLNGRRGAAWSYPFTVFSKLPIRELQPLIQSDGIVITLLMVDLPLSTGQTGNADPADSTHELIAAPGQLVLYLVDLPSERNRPRARIAQQVRELLAALPEPPPAPDVVLGDFNMTRMSHSMRVAFPNMHHAYDDAGAGYAATFHRDWPYFQIDHILLAGKMRAVRYEILDPGVGRHFAQAAWIRSEDQDRSGE